jgi:hypothetical protein
MLALSPAVTAKDAPLTMRASSDGADLISPMRPHFSRRGGFLAAGGMSPDGGK